MKYRSSRTACLWLAVYVFIAVVPTDLFAAAYRTDSIGCESQLKNERQHPTRGIRKEVAEAKIYSIDKLTATHYRLGLGMVNNNEFALADFHAFEETSTAGIESPLNSVAAYELDQHLNAGMNISPSIPYELNGLTGVLSIQPSLNTSRRNLRPVVSKRFYYDQTLFDYLIHLRNRPNSDLVVDKSRRLCLTNNWFAFGLSHAAEARFQLPQRQFEHLRMAWRLASPELKGRILRLTPQTLEGRVGNYLSPLQLRQLWERTEYIQLNVGVEPR